jgi:hypothetical protein
VALQITRVSKPYHQPVLCTVLQLLLFTGYLCLTGFRLRTYLQHRLESGATAEAADCLVEGQLITTGLGDLFVGGQLLFLQFLFS